MISRNIRIRCFCASFAVLLCWNSPSFSQPRYPFNGGSNVTGQQPFPAQQPPPSAFVGNQPPQAIPGFANPAISQGPLPGATSTRQATQTQSEIFEPAEIIATVGDEQILAGDFNFQVNLMFESVAGKYPEEALQAERRRIIQRLLPSLVESKMLYVDFLRTIPLDKLDESMGQIQPRVRSIFREQLKKMTEDMENATDEELVKLRRRDTSGQLFNLAVVMKKRGLLTLGELDNALREYGSSLEKEQRLFGERALGQNAMSTNIDFKPEITFDELHDRYRATIDEYVVLPKAKWEQLTVFFSNHPTKADAYRKLASMGNSVLKGAPFSAVAKRESEGLKSDEGGFHDWTDRGSLASEKLEGAIFTLETDKLSRIIEDDRSFHIVRVLDREEGGHIPFVDAQKDIKEVLRREKIQEQMQNRLKELKEQIPVWTAFDDDVAATAALPR